MQRLRGAEGAVSNIATGIQIRKKPTQNFGMKPSYLKISSFFGVVDNNLPDMLAFAKVPECIPNPADVIPCDVEGFDLASAVHGHEFFHKSVIFVRMINTAGYKM